MTIGPVVVRGYGSGSIPPVVRRGYGTAAAAPGGNPNATLTTRGYGANSSPSYVALRGYGERPSAPPAPSTPATVYGSGNIEAGRFTTRRFWTHGTHAEIAAIRAEVEARVQAQHGPVPAPAAAVINRLALEQAASDGDEVLQLAELLGELDQAAVPWEDHYGGHLAALRQEYRRLYDEDAAAAAALRAEHEERERDRLAGEARDLYLQRQADAQRRRRLLTALLLAS